MTQKEILILLEKAKKNVQALYFERIGLFGSYATATASTMSDVDIAVYSNKKKTGLGFAYLASLEQLRYTLQKLFKRPIDLYDLNFSHQTTIKKHIKQEVIHA